jgi:hypothetical protein
MKMYDALDESELPDLPSGPFIADEHRSKWIEWVDPRADLWYVMEKITMSVRARKSKTENTLFHQVVWTLHWLNYRGVLIVHVC